MAFSLETLTKFERPSRTFEIPPPFPSPSIPLLQDTTVWATSTAVAAGPDWKEMFLTTIQTPTACSELSFTFRLFAIRSKNTRCVLFGVNGKLCWWRWWRRCRNNGDDGNDDDDDEEENVQIKRISNTGVKFFIFILRKFSPNELKEENEHSQRTRTHPISKPADSRATSEWCKENTNWLRLDYWVSWAGVYSSSLVELLAAVSTLDAYRPQNRLKQTQFIVLNWPWLATTDNLPLT